MLKRLVAPAAALVGALLAVRRGHEAIAFAILVGAFFLAQLAWVAPAVMDRIDAGLRRGVQLLLHGLVGLLGSLLLLPLWALFKVVRVDPIRPASRVPGRWRRIEGPATIDTYSSMPAPSGSERWRVRLGGAAVIAAVLGLVYVLPIPIPGISSSSSDDAVPSGLTRPVVEDDGGIPYRAFAFADEPWGKALMDERAKAPLVADPETIWQSGDFAGTYHNVKDRVRRSWTPDDPQLTVWFLGGSAAWGVGQRDGRTIPSMLARDAAADGIRLKVVNMAVPAFTSWQETATLRRELARQDPPDLVIVYHGSNDIGTLDARASEGITPLDRPGNLMNAYAYGFAPPTTGVPVADVDAIARGGLRILKEETRAMTDAAEAAGVPIDFAWQPSLWSGGPNRFDKDAIAANGLYPESLARRRAMEDQIVAGLPPGLIDLRTSLDDAEKPTFFDIVHTNEYGAALIADALWKQIAPQVRMLASAS
ncbi:MAG TPA: SGNH/GDSL hydrolase family protein [Acidimicrobiales bacterium]|nr:SGNH/GDSL hydrolase family protein [Acidimicrobiales bacterium]